MKKVITLLFILNLFLINGCVKYEIQKCEKIIQLEDRDNCYYDLSLKTEDKNICDLIFIQDIKSKCYWHYSEKEMIEVYPSSSKIIDLAQHSLTIKIGELKQDWLGFRNPEPTKIILKLSNTFNISSNNRMINNCRLVNLDFEDQEKEVNPGDVVIIPFDISINDNTKEDICTYNLQVDYGFDKSNLNNTANTELEIRIVK